MPPTALSPEDQAIEIIAQRKFHQMFLVPATDKHGPLKVTYAVIGVQHGEDVPTILFCGGMFGMRWQGIYMNWLAETEGVRLLVIDRPGFGGSTPVKLEQRLPVFLEIVPLLLSHMNIKHISIVSQSAGTIYALNLLSHHPDLLSPTHPSITLLSPWVHQSLSRVSFLVAASMLPNTLLDHWGALTGFVVNNASPAFAASGGVLGAVSSMFKSQVANEKTRADQEKATLEGFGIGGEAKKVLDALVFKYSFKEDSTGANDEARLCLKSVAGIAWDACEDYPRYVEALKQRYEERAGNGPGDVKLQVRVVFAAEDLMVGTKGKQYFEDCWTKEKCGRGIDVECVVIEGTDHDGTVDPSKGALREIFKAIMESRPSFTQGV